MTPIILTLALDRPSQLRFQALRSRWYPAGLNVVPSHVTLFHHLPGSDVPGLLAVVRESCAGAAPMPFQVAGVRYLGRGVAYALRCDAAAALRGRLAAHWARALTPQDRQAWRPHVTIQNKVVPALAASLAETLRQAPPLPDGAAVGVEAWLYQGGPWEALAAIPFAGGAATGSGGFVPPPLPPA